MNIRKSNIILGAVILLLIIVIVAQYMVYHVKDNPGSTSSLMQYLGNLEQSLTGSGTATTTSVTSANQTSQPNDSSASGTTAYSKPFISQLTPAHGTSGLTITIIGSGFDSTTNDITFGPSDGLHSLNGLPANIIATEPSPNGKTLIFNVPIDEPSGLLCDTTGKNCKAVEPVLFPAGTYEVTVTSRGGVSNPAWFVLTH